MEVCGILSESVESGRGLIIYSFLCVFVCFILNFILKVLKVLK